MLRGVPRRPLPVDDDPGIASLNRVVGRPGFLFHRHLRFGGGVVRRRIFRFDDGGVFFRGAVVALVGAVAGGCVLLGFLVVVSSSSFFLDRRVVVVVVFGFLLRLGFLGGGDGCSSSLGLPRVLLLPLLVEDGLLPDPDGLEVTEGLLQLQLGVLQLALGADQLLDLLGADVHDVIVPASLDGLPLELALELLLVPVDRPVADLDELLDLREEPVLESHLALLAGGEGQVLGPSRRVRRVRVRSDVRFGVHEELVDVDAPRAVEGIDVPVVARPGPLGPREDHPPSSASGSASAASSLAG
mmetsp:Transcript_20119/g.47212  ORF Transcript_20119/g.47212 Transcript_20119/m.47212 type:complete len:300 (-) Transcript_20119:211-1110(-)